MAEREGGFDPDDLYAFSLIAMAGGVSAAARRFGRSKATLSRALIRLEAVAGAPLFDRMSSGLRPTALGQKLQGSAFSLLEAVTEGSEVLRQAQAEPSGPLRIGAGALTAQWFIAPVLAGFATCYPQVELQLFVVGNDSDPLADNLDVVVRAGLPSAPYLIAKKLASSPLRLYAPASLRVPIDVNDPAAVETIGRITVTGTPIPTEWVLRKGGETLILNAKPLIAAQDPSVVLGVFSEGYGVAYLPEMYGEPRVRNGSIIAILPGWVGPDLDFYASLPPQRTSVPAVRAFLDALTDHGKRVQRADVDVATAI